MGFHAVAHPRFYQPAKRDALLFDKVLFLGLSENLSHLPIAQAKHLEQLQRLGVIDEVTIEAPEYADVLSVGDARKHYLLSHAYVNLIAVMRSAASSGISPEAAIASERLRQMVAAGNDVWQIDIDEISELARKVFNQAVAAAAPAAIIPSVIHDYAYAQGASAVARVVAICVASKTGIEVTSLLPDAPSADPVLGIMGPVVHIVLNSFPIPTDDTSWDDVVAFRSDPEAVQALRRLRQWIRNAAAAHRSVHEIQDELDHLLHEYVRFMRVHRLKARRSNLETVLSVAASAIDNLSSLKVGSALKALFDVRRHHIDLYEQELKAPGREVAYIAEARERLRGVDRLTSR